MQFFQDDGSGRDGLGEASTTRILFLCGSRRSESYNGRLLRHVAGYLPGHVVADFVLPDQVALPILDQDDEGDPQILGEVRALHARFSAADAFVVASPEYNGQLTAYLKNIIDWVSRLAYIDEAVANPFLDRPLLLCSASTGSSGGAVGIASARSLFGYVGCTVMGSCICVPHVEVEWTGGEFMFNPQFEAWISDTMFKLVLLAEATRKMRPPGDSAGSGSCSGAPLHPLEEVADGTSAFA